MTRLISQNELDQIIKSDLRPIVEAIDRKGYYPIEFLQKLGEKGGFVAASGQEPGGLAVQTEILARIAETCGATAFAAWCQSACLWYLYNSPREAVKQRYIDNVASGRLLAGTGMSNTVKHLANIENHLLKAELSSDGSYRIKGTLPWVSNIGVDHVWAAAAQVADGGYIMFMVDGAREGVSLKTCPEFCALEGTATFSVKFDQVRIASTDLLADAHEFDQFIHAIKPGFVLLQMGLALGLVAASLDTVATANNNNGEVNQFLHHDWQSLDQRYQTLQQQTEQLALDIAAQQVDALAILKTRLAGSELALDAAQSAALHAGAKGYLMKSPVQRRNREAMFVAIVTPALKHLRKEIAILETERAAA